MSNRFYQKYFIRCGNCSAIQRGAQGYKPIPNPILFNSDAHSRSFHNEQRRSAGFVGMRITSRCDKCTRVHSDWSMLDHQQLLDVKGSMTAEERKKLLWD
ncbi:hypothetical protein AGDE_00682 [Angomonas deanei]|uniref:Uncharacterized protein n=1 Tax=Angomonas deanei TaxID=59799 RepID=S9X449_9TRYP|nr:hypothetical protein AGDE_01745 [Angomonas deanei]EPY43240.1 hypothetical protein AGDE_00682 [Angomonas deanei]CAD2222243.1 hypothetical protein, conserved [Angomonas deanei]|eukprot:EPY42178.1 hypothetical protein AGDE_01745 [Angomonas deanei]